jgi:transcriptional regulator with XRE-family HTH domain
MIKIDNPQEAHRTTKTTKPDAPGCPRIDERNAGRPADRPFLAIAGRIREELTARGMSAARLGRAANVAPATLARVMAGQDVRLATLAAVLHVIGLEVTICPTSATTHQADDAAEAQRSEESEGRENSEGSQRSQEPQKAQEAQ